MDIIPQYKVTRLQDKCPECGKVAKEKFSIQTFDKDGNEVKLITLECFHILKKIIPRATPFESIVSNGWKEDIKNCKHEWNKNQCIKCGEYKLYQFQIVGARAAESGLATQRGFGIFDDMGLGKTVQALGLIKFHSDQYTPCMVVTKSAIKFQWFKQAVRWLGPGYISQIISTSRDYLMPGLKLYIIPYDLLRRFPREKLHKLGIRLVILDECQQIKNPDSARTQEVRKLISSNEGCKVLPLSGTPWKNRGNEFFPVLNMMDPVKFHSHQHYLDIWVDYYWQGNKKKMGGIRRPDKFREYTSGMLIRREYNEVMDEFPEVNRMKLNIQLSELEQSAYDDSVSEFVAWYNQAIIDGVEEQLSGIAILAKMARLRHITGLAKIPATLTFIEEFIEDYPEKKLVVFVHHKDVGVITYDCLNECDKTKNPDWWELAKELKESGVEVLKLNAEMNDEQRFNAQETFNKSPKAILIASTLACGEGLDLQTCADSIMHERQWNPQNEDQASPGRFRRIGQTSSVINITFPQAEGTIDEHLDILVEDKRRQFHQVMNKGEAPNWSQDEIAHKLAEMIVQKHRERKSKKGKVISINKEKSA